MSTYDLTNLRTDLTIIIGDEGEKVINSLLDGIPNGARVKFRTQEYPIDSTEFVLYKDDVVQTATTDYTIDGDSGIVTTTIAPDNGTTLSSDYTWYKYKRSTLDEYLIRAAIMSNDKLGWGCTISGTVLSATPNDTEKQVILLASQLLLLRDDMVQSTDLSFAFTELGTRVDRSMFTRNKQLALKTLEDIYDNAILSADVITPSGVRVESAEYIGGTRYPSTAG